MKEQQPKPIKENQLRHQENLHIAHNTIYKGKFYLHGQGQTPLTQQERQNRRSGTPRGRRT